MEIVTMGKVVVPAKIENLRDLNKVEEGTLTADKVRSVEVPDAVADTGATMLSLPRRLVQQLGLKRQRTRTAKTPGGVFSFGIYENVRLTVQGRDCDVTVAEIPDECPVLIGQIPLELLDYIVDPVGQRLLGNPDHNGEQWIDMF